MASRLLLIRHGPSAHRLRSAWVDSDGVLRWREAYDRAGITPGAAPPASLIEAVSQCAVIVSSDLPRARESMERLAAGRLFQQSALLRESPLAVPHLPLRMPVTAWDMVITALWGWRILRGQDASRADRERAAEAMSWLMTLGGADDAVAVTTHGVFRRILASTFLEAGWRVVRPRPPYEHWSVWTVERRLPQRTT